MTTWTGSPDWQDPRQPQGGVDILSTGYFAAGLTAYSTVTSLTQGQYQRYLVQVFPQTTCMVSAQVIDPVIGPGPIAWRYTLAGNQALFALPASGGLGITPTVSVTMSVAAVGVNNEVQCIGLRYFPERYRLDGNAPCSDSLSATWVPATGSTTVVAAPTSPQRLLVGTIVLPNVLSTAAGNTGRLLGLRATINTPLATLIAGTASDAGNPPFRGSGILLDVGAAITQNFTAAITNSTVGAVYYDIVT